MNIVVHVHVHVFALNLFIYHFIPIDSHSANLNICIQRAWSDKFSIGVKIYTSYTALVSCKGSNDWNKSPVLKSCYKVQ